MLPNSNAELLVVVGREDPVSPSPTVPTPSNAAAPAARSAARSGTRKRRACWPTSSLERPAGAGSACWTAAESSPQKSEARRVTVESGSGTSSVAAPRGGPTNLEAAG